MHPFEMVLGIVLITAVASVFRAKMGVVRTHRGERFVGRGSQPDPATERLRDEVKQLKERVAVLERLATDGSSALDREFEKLKQID